MTSPHTECVHGLHEVRRAGGGLGGCISTEEGTKLILLGLELAERPPGLGVFQLAPDTLDRGQLRAIGG